MEQITMTPEIARQLREPFPPEHVGKLPRIWCRNCRDAAKRGGACDQHRKARCQGCHNNITTAHLHLDYVGHAEVTDRFLQVDPEWDWEPFAIGPDGLPAIDKYGGMWIRLTIAGKTRIGYGHADGKEGPDAVKEAIGDALRNSGMRFGVGLDLWGAKFKEDNQSEATSGADSGEPAPPPQPTPRQIAEFDQLAKLVAAAESEESLRNVWDALVEAYRQDDITTAQANELKAAMAERRTDLATGLTEPAEAVSA